VTRDAPKILFLFALLLAPLFAGCSTAGYYWQAAGGQMELWWKRRDIEAVVGDPTTDAGLRARLQQVQAARAFAMTELHLPDNGSYRHYADLGRPYAVWNVFATPEFSLTPREWCFPVAGCVGYRGYFAEADARAEAEALRREGYEVYVAPVAAYSTLGWFRDPVLNTLLRRSDVEVAALLFHELAHQLLYVAGDSAFNESFASAVEAEGRRRWAENLGDARGYTEFRAAERRRGGFAELVGEARAQLAALFQSSATDPEHMRHEKQRIRAQLRARYQQLRDGSWGGRGDYEAWFSQDLNNAQLASVGLYHVHVASFEQLLRREGGNMQAFYAAARALAGQPREERERALRALAAEAENKTAALRRP